MDQPQITKKPTHIAFIMDGNRRWAKSQGKFATTGHKEGALIAEEAISWCVKENIPYVTLWALSTDNWQKRSATELTILFKLIESIPTRAEKMKKYGVTLKFLGRRRGLPESVQNSLEKAEKLMHLDNPKHTVYLAINYGGRDEILHAIEDILANPPEKITEEVFSQHLFTKDVPDVDLIIRTGGAQRLSGFMPWQSVYSELYFTDTFWPGLTAEEFQRALEYYDGTKRNFGK
ncbi:MAG: polyprenyl diphosphate synthase [Candidatus Gracilibacteria bacterium]